MSNHPTKRSGAGSSSSVPSDEDGHDAPTAFGRYQVIRHLASGGMGSVYLASDGVLQREVAVKSIRPMPGKLGREFGARFLNEARCVASLKHPNIVPIFDLGLEGESPYLVMEVVEGPALGDMIADAPMTARQARTVGIQIANALAEAHKAGIVHRDVKPANILRASEDNWKLVDFGVAHIPDSSLTTVGDFLGTPAYAAPESLEGNGFSPASDVYGLAATLYHALCGTPPHGIGNAVKIALRASSQPAPSLGESNSTLPADIVLIVDQCLSSDPSRRPSAAALAEQLASARPDTFDGIAESEARLRTVDPTTPHEGSGSPSATGTGMASRRGAGLLLLLAGAGLAALFLLSDEPPSSSQEVEEPSAALTPTPATTKPRAAGSEVAESEPAESEPAESEPAESEPAESGGAPKNIEASESKTIAPAHEQKAAIGEPEAGLTGLDEIRKLIARKRSDEAIRRLDLMRRKHPESAYLPFLQGTLQMQRRYWKDGFAAYRAAIGKDGRYREHPTLIANGIRALYSKSQPWRGSKFLQEIGEPARPALEQALADGSNPKIKGRIVAILKKM